GGGGRGGGCRGKGGGGVGGGRGRRGGGLWRRGGAGNRRMAGAQMPAHALAAGGLGRRRFVLSSSTVPSTAPAALAARSRLYQPPASSVPRGWADSGI